MLLLLPLLLLVLLYRGGASLLGKGERRVEPYALIRALVKRGRVRRVFLFFLGCPAILRSLGKRQRIRFNEQTTEKKNIAITCVDSSSFIVVGVRVR